MTEVGPPFHVPRHSHPWFVHREVVGSTVLFRSPQVQPPLMSVSPSSHAIVTALEVLGGTSTDAGPRVTNDSS